MVKPEYLKEEYPFDSSFMTVRQDVKLHYLDLGAGSPMVMLHGNPTWSYFYRHLINEFQSDFRVIAPDHIGCGLSDKPKDWKYDLENHISTTEMLIDKLGLRDITLVVHDWGGAIGFGVAVRHPEWFKKIVILNTAAYTSKWIPFRINLCRIPIIGEQLIRRMNGFAGAATYMAVTKKLSKKVKKGYLYPYRNYKDRIAIDRFVKDIPLSTSHPSFKTLYQIETTLDKIKCPKLVLWGGADFCFNKKFFHRWGQIYPDAQLVMIEKAGHYIVEDARDEVISRIKDFVK